MSKSVISVFSGPKCAEPLGLCRRALRSYRIIHCSDQWVPKREKVLILIAFMAKKSSKITVFHCFSVNITVLPKSARPSPVGPLHPVLEMMS